MDKTIELREYSEKACHDFFKNYVEDPILSSRHFTYDVNKVAHYYQLKSSDKNRIIFGIYLENTIIGEIQLKAIDLNEKCGTLSIILVNDSVKGKGYGTKAESLIIEYAFNELRLNKIYADTTLANVVSQHILLKLGFKHIKDDQGMRYYELSKA